MKINTFIILFLLTTLVFAQNETVEEAIKFYPLQIGNYWQYASSFSDGWGNDSSWYSYREVIGDTVINGKRYFNIKESGMQTLLSNLVRIDSSNGFIYSFIDDSTEYLEEILYVQNWDSTSCENYGEVYLEDVFFQSFETRPYFGCIVISGCTRNRKLSKSLGIIEWIYNCANVVGSTEKFILNYAKVNNVEYGVFVSVNEKLSDEIPLSFSLMQNYPNPFNPTTKIEYSVPILKNGKIPTVKLTVYDVLGREVKILVNERKTAGNYNVAFNAADLPSGIYYYQVIAESFVETKKMLFLK